MFEVITIGAIIVGPILAVQAEKYLERKRAERERRLHVFKTLMVTRGAVLSPAHVGALNSIDIEFKSDDNNDKKVRNAWKAYLDELNNYPKDRPEAHQVWYDKIETLLVALLSEMSAAVGYDFDKTHIKRAAYTPLKYSQMELADDIIRDSLVKLFSGKIAFPVEMKNTPQLTEAQKSLQKLLIEYYKGEKPIRVIIERNE